MSSYPFFIRGVFLLSAAYALTACLPQQGAIVGDIDGETSDDRAVQIEPSASPSPSIPANVLPQAQAGADQIVTLPTNVAALVGSGSDADGSVASYRWTKVSGPSTVAFVNASAASTSISGLTLAGAHVFRLTVTDDRGATASDDVQVTVSAPPASPNPTPSTVTVPVEEGLPPTGNFTACTLEVWQRNLPNKGFNNLDTVVYLPCDYYANPTKKYPLVISNHGRGGSTLDTATHSQVGGKNFEGMIKQLRNNANLRATYGAIVLAPDLHAVGNGGDFFPGKGLADMEARLVLDAIKHLRVDPKRVTVTGLSYGGQMTEDMMIHYLPLLAGAMPVAIQPPNKGNITAANTCRYVSLPLWAHGNKDDGVYNYYDWTRPDNGFRTVLRNCSGFVEGQYFRITANETGGHSGWDQHYAKDEVLNWLMNQIQP